MIKFEVYSTFKDIPPYPISIYFQSFLIGNSSKCHIKIYSKSQNFPCLKCDLQETKVTLQTTNDQVFFLNGKKVLGLATIVVGDLIKLENQSLRVLEIDQSSPNRELDHSALYDDFFQRKEEFEPILKSIEKELIYSTDELISTSTSTKKRKSHDL